MKKINLNGITNSLSDGEMKLVKGGNGTPEAVFDIGEGSGGGGTLSPKQEACKPPIPIGAHCQWRDAYGALHGGRCVQILWSPPHCSNLN